MVPSKTVPLRGRCEKSVYLVSYTVEFSYTNIRFPSLLLYLATACLKYQYPHITSLLFIQYMWIGESSEVQHTLFRYLYMWSPYYPVPDISSLSLYLWSPVYSWYLLPLPIVVESSLPIPDTSSLSLYLWSTLSQYLISPSSPYTCGVLSTYTWYLHLPPILVESSIPIPDIFNLSLYLWSPLYQYMKCPASPNTCGVLSANT